MKHNNWRLSALLFFALVILAIPSIATSESKRILDYYLYDDFRQYPAREIYAGNPAPVVFGIDSEAKLFHTRITEGAKHGPNFAGIYTVIEWGCGTNCQQIAVANARTGRLSDWITTELGSSYQIDSILFVKNPDTKKCSLLEWCKTSYYSFEKGKFVLIE